MHISEGILPVTHSAGWFALAAPFVWASARKIRCAQEENSEKVFVGMVTALCFSVTLLPLPVPVVGATSHICGTPFFSILRGPVFMALPAAVILLIQALFFSHGGLTSLGANIFTLGVIGPFAAFYLFRCLRQFGFSEWVSVLASCFVADILVYVADAFILGAALGISVSPIAVSKAILLGFAPVQLPLALLEGFVSAVLYREIKKRNPSFLGPQKVSVRPPVSFGVLLSLVLSVLTISACWGRNSFAADYVGIDDSVMAQIARSHGKNAGPVFEWGSTEVTLFVFSLGNFLAGFWTGKGWSRLFNHGERNAS